MNDHFPQREYDRAKTDRIIANEMLSHSMSDAKWVRLFNALSQTIEPSIAVQVKLVWDQQPRSMWVHGAQYSFDYYAKSMEAMIGGYPRGWYDYKEIEWIAFEGSAECLGLLMKQIEAIGRFDIELSPDALRLYAYRRTVNPQEVPK